MKRTKKQQEIVDFNCETCFEKYSMDKEKGLNRTKRKIAGGRFLCEKCTRLENNKRLVQSGTAALSKISKENRKLNASKAGKISSTQPNKGRFTTERWEEKTEEDKQLHVSRANKALWDKIKTDADFKALYYKNTYGNRKIGFISKGQREVFEAVKLEGFEEEILIEMMSIDVCNKELKIAIEYNGDYWHCNPRTWKADQYNPAIKMFAKDKWTSDMKRVYYLKSLGYTVVTVWENDWKTDKESCLKRIYDAIDKKRNYRKTEML